MKRNESLLTVRSLAILITIFGFASCGFAANPTEKVLYSFTGGADGAGPFAGVVADAQGNFYGTTANGGNGACQGGCGTVFELSPNSDGTWTETQLYSFSGGNDGSAPESGVIFDSTGSLYGTTIHGGASNDGTVFRLSAPAKPGSAWVETVLYTFVGARDGEYCLGSLVFDPAGNLYGAAVFGGHFGGGTVFQLLPPTQGNAWSLNVLHAFKGTTDGIDPLGALVLDSKGAVYGATYSGTVFKLNPPSPGSSKWTLKVLYGFGSLFGVGALLPGKPAVFYGTTTLGGAANEGTVFQLTSPSSTTLYEFAGGSDGGLPLNGLVADRAGNLYGITQTGGDFGAGTVFKLAPPAQQGGTWTKTTLHSFHGGSDGSGPGAGVIFGPHGALYGTTVSGGSSGKGTVFEVTP
jgi:uncharacterized repeat protein (TIGR03803 family)